MKRFLISISMLFLLRSEVISIAVLCVLMGYGVAWLLKEAAKGGAF